VDTCSSGPEGGFPLDFTVAMKAKVGFDSLSSPISGWKLEPPHFVQMHNFPISSYGSFGPRRDRVVDRFELLYCEKEKRSERGVASSRRQKGVRASCWLGQIDLQ